MHLAKTNVQISFAVYCEADLHLCFCICKNVDFLTLQLMYRQFHFFLFSSLTFSGLYFLGCGQLLETDSEKYENNICERQ